MVSVTIESSIGKIHSIDFLFIVFLPFHKSFLENDARSTFLRVYATIKKKERRREIQNLHSSRMLIQRPDRCAVVPVAGDRHRRVNINPALILFHFHRGSEERTACRLAGILLNDHPVRVKKNPVCFMRRVETPAPRPAPLRKLVIFSRF